MPLVRFQVRNEFSLGQAQLYKEANREDPKAVLDGVTVAGLVGILRQLGDLAEFAAEVFHGLQEQVTTTASRSHKLMVRVQHIEAALPPLEKAVLAQTGHIHFAYTAGLEWHPRIRNERNHFVYNDLPRFIMDSYEDCQDPPCLHLLDKFDTGGPGSCLKRYSDPTFFKRASVIPDDANAEKVQRDRKAQRSKKKRGSQLNGDVSHGASISNHSSRMQPISIVNGRSSPSQTASTSDMALKSDTGNNSNSFDSRTGSGYIDFVAHSNSSMQAKQQEYMESPTTESVQHGGTLESVLPNFHTGPIDGDSPGSTLQDQVTSGSSCGNWDEKAEIVDPNGHQNCIDGTTNILPTKDHLEEHERASGNIITIEQMEFLFDGENILESTSSRNRIDEIDSEPDNFMDALNTIESEPENDLDCQTKREVEHFASVVNRKGLDGLHEITMDCSDRHTETSSISPEKEVSVDLPNSATLESPVHEQMPHIDMEPSNSDHSLGFDSTDILDSSRLEIVNVDNPDHQTPRFETHTVNDELASSGSVTANEQDNSVSSLCDSQNPPADLTRNNSINFWTNGGLLGLEPSKPPDFSMASPVNPAGGSTCETVGLSNHAYKLIVDEHETERSLWTENAGCNNKDQEDGISSEKIFKVLPATELYPKLGKNGDSFMSNGFSRSMEIGWKETNIMERGTLLSVGPYDKSASKGLNQEIDENSSLVFGLGRRLLENGFGRNATYAHGDTCEREPASFLNAGELEQTNKHHRAVYRSFPDAAFKQQSENGFSFDSSPSSPPLEQMKISFHPINGIETSKLKLKLCNGNQTHESARDMFQSFQLIPEPAIPLHEFGSDSDDDTFCRSSPYISDDCVSHHSESHSEQWESSGTPERDNNELYDALRGISSVEHISTSPELREMANTSIYFDDGIKFVNSENGLYSLEHSFSDSLLDLPSLNAFKPVLLPETKDDSSPKELHGLRCPGESMPEPPPLPPVEWCVSKPHLDAAEEKQDVSEGFKQVLHTELAGSITSQRPPVKHQQVNEDPISIQPKSKEQQLNEQKEADRALNGKGIDEKDDFLQQIRTQSFNLRRTVTAKATTATPGPATNVKVTAILEKANAIRQAVGSDDGDDDDTWSDT